MLHDVPVIAREHDRGLDVMAGTIQYPATHEHLASKRTHRAERLLEGANRTFIDQWSDQRRRIAWIADARLPVGVHQALLQLRKTRSDDEHPPRRRAALPGSAECPEYDRVRGKVKICTVIDDYRSVTTELEQCFPQTRRDRLSHLPPNRG